MRTFHFHFSTRRLIFLTIVLLVIFHTIYWLTNEHIIKLKLLGQEIDLLFFLSLVLVLILNISLFLKYARKMNIQILIFAGFLSFQLVHVCFKKSIYPFSNVGMYSNVVSEKINEDEVYVRVLIDSINGDKLRHDHIEDKVVIRLLIKQVPEIDSALLNFYSGSTIHIINL